MKEADERRGGLRREGEGGRGKERGWGRGCRREGEEDGREWREETIDGEGDAVKGQKR